MSETVNVLRTEKKFLVSPIVAGQISARLSQIMDIDVNCRDGKPYQIRSIYFDSIYNKDYHDKINGLECRKKIRLRTYGSAGPNKLEWKEKQGEKQQKKSILIDDSDAEELLRGNYRCLLKYEGELPRQFYAVMSEQVYRPRCLVQYDRQAYVLSGHDIRVTLDSNLTVKEGCFTAWKDFDGGYPVELGKNVLEIKFNHSFPHYIKTALAEYGLTEVANSKYIAGRSFGLGGNV